MSRSLMTAALMIALATPALAQTADTTSSPNVTMPDLQTITPDTSTYEQREVAAKPYAELAVKEMNIPKMVSTMWQPFVGLAAKKGHPLDDKQKAALDALYQKTFDGPMRDAMLNENQVIAKAFTMQEIQAMNAFYTSPIGRSILTKMPQVMTAIQPEISAMVQKTMPKIMPEIKAIIDPKKK
ncbi:DUF2059 domain-containing protein [Thioclava indica]|uniref:DUF2059 domain-containing protein n=1 Tax=Thioclava indica TaxID=1353528 RepID=A0A074JW45_9RHOB|nr:DUF2059 domain-containing protein [Thioclava indica]KEO60684.1 hypothetical protein DT23_12640 [Thioclava indica]